MRTLTGITPSGTLHIGNYFGAMRPAIEAQAKGDCFYFIADYHSMTSVTDPKERRADIRGNAVDWLACGLDPKKSVFWRQSDVPEVCELTWLIGSLTPQWLMIRESGIGNLQSDSFARSDSSCLRDEATSDDLGMGPLAMRSTKELGVYMDRDNPGRGGRRGSIDTRRPFASC